MKAGFIRLSAEEVAFQRSAVVYASFFLLALFHPPELYAAPPPPRDFYLARALIEQREYQAGARMADSLAGVLPSRLRGRISLLAAEAYLAMGMPDSAKARIEQLPSVYQSDAQFIQCQILARDSQCDALAGEMKSYLKRSVKRPESRLRGDSLLRSCEGNAAYDSLWLHDWYSPAQRFEGELAYHAAHGDWHLMLELLDQYPRRRRERVALQLFRAQALIGIGSYASAASLLASIKPKRATKVRIYALRVEVALRQNKGKSAMKFAQEAYEADAQDPVHEKRLARAFLLNAQYGKAIETLQAYLSLYPQEPEALRLAAQAFELDANYAKALQMIAKALPKVNQPEQAKLYAQRGKILYKMGEFRQALVDLRRAMEIAPEDTVAINCAAQAYVKLNQPREACELLKRHIPPQELPYHPLFSTRCRGRYD